MSPRPLDVEAVGRRLVEISRLLTWLESLGPIDAQRLSEDWQVRLLTERILEQVVELAVGINIHVVGGLGGMPGDTYRASFTSLAEHGVIDPALAAALQPSAGLRNALAHAYLDIDLSAVAAAAPLVLTEFAAYRDQVGRWLTDRAAEADEVG